MNGQLDDFEAAAERMFGATTPTSAAPSANSVSHTDFDNAAARMFGSTTPTSAPPTTTTPQSAPQTGAPRGEEDQARSLYGGTDPTLTHADATQAIVNAAMEHMLHNPATAGEIAGEWAAVFSEHNLNASESKALADAGVQAITNPPTPELVHSWTETALLDLKTTYGVQGAGQALQDARSYIASRPGLPDLIDALGLGSHPKLVALAAARGRAMRMRGGQ